MNETQENNENLSKIYKNRRRKLALQMKNQGVAAILFEDKDGCRDPSVRYYTGHPNDALFILFSDETSFLVAWDENLAKKMANVGKIIPYSRYENSHIRAVRAIANYAKIEGKQTFELPEVTSYPDFLQYVDALSGWDVRCRKQSLHNFRNLERIKYWLSSKIRKTEIEAAEGERKKSNPSKWDSILRGEGTERSSFGVYAEAR